MGPGHWPYASPVVIQARTTLSQVAELRVFVWVSGPGENGTSPKALSVSRAVFLIMQIKWEQAVLVGR